MGARTEPRQLHRPGSRAVYSTYTGPRRQLGARCQIAQEWTARAEADDRGASFSPGIVTALTAVYQTVAAAHWLQLEKYEEVNAIMRKWLNQNYPPTSEGSQIRDEL